MPARSTAFHVQHLVKTIEDGLNNRGFSFIEALVQCPTAYGRRNKLGDPAKMMAWMRDNAVMKTAWDKLPDDKRGGDKFPIGLFFKAEAEPYDAAYHHVQELAGGAAK